MSRRCIHPRWPSKQLVRSDWHHHQSSTYSTNAKSEPVPLLSLSFYCSRIPVSTMMWRSSISLLLPAIFSTLFFSVVSGFTPIIPATVEVNVASQQTLLSTTTTTTANVLQTGVQSFVQNVNANVNDLYDSSTITLSLKERPPPPTKEEIAAKKRNFSVWFWGGGFVAPFLATIYYFGPKFWTK